ncbi:UNVERIFIED_CONTAM: hypothetical protein K2H54_044407 [Gekko kuhli]
MEEDASNWAWWVPVAYEGQEDHQEFEGPLVSKGFLGQKGYLDFMDLKEKKGRLVLQVKMAQKGSRAVVVWMAPKEGQEHEEAGTLIDEKGQPLHMAVSTGKKSPGRKPKTPLPSSQCFGAKQSTFKGRMGQRGLTGMPGPLGLRGTPGIHGAEGKPGTQVPILYYLFNTPFYFKCCAGRQGCKESCGAGGHTVLAVLGGDGMGGGVTGHKGVLSILNVFAYPAGCLWCCGKPWQKGTIYKEIPSEERHQSDYIEFCYATASVKAFGVSLLFDWHFWSLDLHRWVITGLFIVPFGRVCLASLVRRGCRVLWASMVTQDHLVTEENQDLGAKRVHLDHLAREVLLDHRASSETWALEDFLALLVFVVWMGQLVCQENLGQWESWDLLALVNLAILVELVSEGWTESRVPQGYLEGKFDQDQKGNRVMMEIQGILVSQDQRVKRAQLAPGALLDCLGLVELQGKLVEKDRKDKRAKKDSWQVLPVQP